MKRLRWLRLGLVGCALLLAISASAEVVKLHLATEGTTPPESRPFFNRLILADGAPAALRKVPDGLIAPEYQVLRLGPQEHPTSIIVVVDAPDGSDPRLFVDVNANGDLTDDPSLAWTKQGSQDRSGRTTYTSAVTISVRYDDATIPLHIDLEMFHYPKSDSGASLHDVLLYHVENGYAGEITLGGKTYTVRLADFLGKGDFRGITAGGPSGIQLLIDVNGNGVFDKRGEAFDIGLPFNIRGTTYQITNMSASGMTFTVVKSSQKVPEIPPPPDLRPGKKVVAFTARTTTDQTVHFPASYKGKLVLLYFWATWCPDCRNEVPYVTRAYAAFHPQGLEILGVSLDKPDSAAILKDFTRANNMPWAQIYDGKYWDAALAQLYAVTSTPTIWLVDGDTGKVLATTPDLRGDHLAGTLQKVLAAKKPDTRVGRAEPQ